MNFKHVNFWYQFVRFLEWYTLSYQIQDLRLKIRGEEGAGALWDVFGDSVFLFPAVFWEDGLSFQHVFFLGEGMAYTVGEICSFPGIGWGTR